MLRIPWDDLRGEEFEELCFELLREPEFGDFGFTNVEWFNGPSDRGRDLIADKIIDEFKGRQRVEQWVIQCKRKADPITPSDLRPSFDWAEARDFHGLMLITTSHLTNDTRDWVSGYFSSQRPRYRFTYVERAELEMLGRGQRELLARYFGDNLAAGGPGRQARAAFFEQAAELWSANRPREQNLRRLQRHFIDYQEQYGDLEGTEYAQLYTEQRHAISYSARGYTRSRYMLTLANIGTQPIPGDSLYVGGEAPVQNSDSLRLAVESYAGSSVVGLDNIAPDTPNLKVVRIAIADGLAPLELCRYAVTMDWPFPMPLADFRYYTIPIFRLALSVQYRITVPRQFTPTHVVALAGRDPEHTRITPPSVATRARFVALSGTIAKPIVDSSYKVMFWLTTPSE
jgi:hypothetical protein